MLKMYNSHKNFPLVPHNKSKGIWLVSDRERIFMFMSAKTRKSGRLLYFLTLPPPPASVNGKNQHIPYRFESTLALNIWYSEGQFLTYLGNIEVLGVLQRGLVLESVEPGLKLYGLILRFSTSCNVQQYGLV
jgi:hypothetical protein